MRCTSSIREPQSSRSRFVQLIEHVRVRDKVAVEQEISRNRVAAGRAVAAAAARGSAAGRAADSVIGDSLELIGLRALLDVEVAGEGLEAVRLNGQCVLALILQMVARAAFSIGVVVQHEQILTEQIVVGDLLKRGGLAGRIGERYLFDRVGDAVDQIADSKVQVLARFRIVLDREGRCVMVLDMDGRERRGLDATAVGRGHADVIATVGAEIILIERNGQRRDHSAVVLCRALRKVQIAVPRVLVLVVGDELNRASLDEGS